MRDPAAMRDAGRRSMDPLTQGALGAVVGQLAGHRRLGYRAATIGALAAMVPDLDVVFPGDYFDQLVAHRGITHGLPFALLCGPLAGALVWKLEQRHEARRKPPQPDPPAPRDRLRAWMLVMTLALLSHPLLDLMTPYGTQLLAPFSDTRYAINAMPIIDPLYTLILLGGLLLAGRWLRTRAVAVAGITLLLSCTYIGYAWHLNHSAERYAAQQLHAAGIETERISAFPTIAQIHLRRVVARSAGADRVGHLSLWRQCDIEWNTAARAQDGAIARLLESREGRIFDWFTMGWGRYRMIAADDRHWIIGSDLRYGVDTNPDNSVFRIRAPLSADGALLEPAEPLSDLDRVDRSLLRGLLRQAYPVDCG